MTEAPSKAKESEIKMRKELAGLLRSWKMKPKYGGLSRTCATMARRTPFTYEMLEQYQRLGPDPHLSHVYRIDENTAVKFGDSVRMAEAAAMGFVREKTSIPIPEVYDSYVQDGSKYGCIVMEYVNGSRLDEEWESYDKGQKDGIISQLKQYFNELRSTPGTFVGSVDLTHCEDQFFSDDRGSYCPFESEAAFNDGLIRAVRARGSHSWAEMVVRFIKALPRHKIVLTHNDLSPRNILVRNAKVVAIVDWELSGFYPAYWEYVKAYFWPDWESPWVTEGIVDKIIEPFTLELAYMLHVRDII